MFLNRDVDIQLVQGSQINVSRCLDLAYWRKNSSMNHLKQSQKSDYSKQLEKFRIEDQYQKDVENCLAKTEVLSASKEKKDEKRIDPVSRCLDLADMHKMSSMMSLKNKAQLQRLSSIGGMLEKNKIEEQYRKEVEKCLAETDEIFMASKGKSDKKEEKKDEKCIEEVKKATKQKVDQLEDNYNANKIDFEEYSKARKQILDEENTALSKCKK